VAPAVAEAGDLATVGEADEVSTDAKQRWRFPKDRRLQHVLPLAPKDYPEALQGIAWLDQTGFYGETTLVGSFPDYCISMGDPKYPLNRLTRTIVADAAGPTWQWHNSEEGYGFVSFAALTNFKYKSHWNKDYTQAQVIPTLWFSWLGKITIPPWLLDFKVTVLPKPEEGVCPPKPDATPKQRSRCAKYRRDSVFLPAIPGLSFEIGTYYAFEVVDGDGKPVQPYYDQYLAYEDTQTKPDAEAAKKYLGIEDLEAAGGMRRNTFLIGSGSNVVPGYSASGGPCTNMYTPVGFTICAVRFVNFLMVALV